MIKDDQQEPTQLLDYLRAVRRRWRTVAALTLLVTAAAVGFSLASEKQYDATVELLLQSQEPVDELLDINRNPAASDPERELNTEVELIKVGPAAAAARRQLGLRRSTETLLRQVETETSTSTNIVALRVRDPDPILSARIANGLADAYVASRLDAARRRYAQASALAQRQLEALDAAERRSPEGRELAQRVRDLQMGAALQLGSAEVVRRATIPKDAARPRPRLSAALGVMLGLLLGVGVALVRELFDRRFKDEKGVERFFGRPILAAIPRSARGRGALRGAREAEVYGLLAANLGLSSVAGSPRTSLMITSSAPAEGKTSTTFGIAQACARLGLRVIAIEADLRRPAFGRYANVSGAQGVAGVLDGTALLIDELLTLDGHDLKPYRNGAAQDGTVAVVPAGPLLDNPQQALSRPAMRALIDEARALADVVLIDTSPIGTVNDAVALTGLVDGVVLVVRLNSTTKDAARRAMRVLTNVGAPAYDVVVTDATGVQSADYYSQAGAPRQAVESRR